MFRELTFLGHSVLLLLCPFNYLFSRTTSVSQKGKTGLDVNKARDNGDGSDISWVIYVKSLHLASGR